MKYISIVKFALIALSVVVILLYVTGVLDDYQSTEVMLQWGYFMLGFAVLCVIVFPLIALMQNPAGAMRSLIGLLIVLAVVFGAYLLGSGEPVTTPSTTYDNVFALKVSDAGLYTTYLALFLTIAVILIGEVRNFFK